MLNQVQHDAEGRESTFLQAPVRDLLAGMGAPPIPSFQPDARADRLADIEIRRSDTFVTFAPLEAAA